MPQTFLVLVAIALLSVLSLNRLQESRRLEAGAIETETEFRALALATQLLDEVSAAPFDARVPVTDPLTLTPAAAFGGGGGPWAAAADVDDYHGRELRTALPGRDAGLPAVATAEVRYVARSGAGYGPSAVPTFEKEVIVTVDVGGVPARLTRVVSYLGQPAGL